MSRYAIHNRESLVGLNVSKVDWTPTTFSYGTCEVHDDLSNDDLENLGLYIVDEDFDDIEAERDALIRAEAPHMFR